MGLDAPSTDLTARIQRKRRELLQQGLVEPARPGEQVMFRGGTLPVPTDAPVAAGDSRVVPLDETPTRGGLAATVATDEVGADGTQTEEPPEAAEVTGAADDPGPVEPLVNEFGEAYDPNDDGGFDLGDEPQPTTVTEPPAVERPKAKAKRRSAADGIVQVLAEIETLKALCGAIEFRLDNIEQRMRKDDVEQANIVGRFDELDASLLLIAQFLSQQAKEAEAAIPVEPEIPSFMLRPKRGRIARFFLGD